MSGVPISTSRAEHTRRVQICIGTVTLDGERARIFGLRQPFASVMRCDGKGGHVEFSWDAAARIVAKGGAFTS